MPDGTVKQINPYSGASVWTVPGRGNRPLAQAGLESAPIDPEAHGRHCAFCHLRYLETPPEKARVVVEGDRSRVLEGVLAEQLYDTVAEFRRVPNLFEIVSYDYWRLNYGYHASAAARRHHDAYVATNTGREHVEAMIRARAAATHGDRGTSAPQAHAHRMMAFFAGCHDLIIAERHFVDGARTRDQLASSGSLTPQEHGRYVSFTVDAVRSLFEANRYARYVAVFQNWLRPAGASFDHLHKQLVAVDERSVRTERELHRLRENSNFYNEHAVGYAGRQNLVIAENDAGVAFAGFGHRYPSVEIYSKDEHGRPWEQSPDQVRGVSDLVHAIHAATGADVACNEEWHYQPPDVDLPMPWRVVVKWRVSTLAGFEGGTKIYLNTIDPWSVRDRVVARLVTLRREGRVDPSLRVGQECNCRPNSLRYNPILQ